jgi:hypothetical protein
MINLTPKLAAVLSGHGKMRAYFHRFNIREDAACSCGQGDQTMDHLLFQCTRDEYTRRAPKTPNKQAKELAGKQTRPHIQASEKV